MSGFPLRLALRELRAGKGRFLAMVLALAVGFAAYFATSLFAEGVLRGVKAESRALLGADLVVSSQGLLPEGLKERIHGLRGIAAVSEVYDFPTMAGCGRPEENLARLVEVRAVDEAYPLVGAFEASPALVRPRRGLFVDASLAEAWGLRPAGAEADLLANRQALRLGDGVVPIAGVITVDDSRQAGAFALGPRVVLDLETTRVLHLVTPRARLSGRLLATLAPGGDGPAVLAAVRQAAGPGLKVQGHEEAANALARPLRNLNRFVQLLGLFTLVLAAMGAWAILAAFLESRAQEAAVLRCLGAPPSSPVFAYALLGGLLLGTSALAGLGLGAAVAAVLPGWLGDLLPPALRSVTLAPPPLVDTALVLMGLALLLVPSLFRLARVRPLALLREGMDQAVAMPWGVRLAPLGGAVAAGLLVVRHAPTRAAGLGTALALGLLLLTLFGLARLLVTVYRQLLPRLPLSLRLGLGQVGARPSLSALLMTVMGLSVFLTLASQFLKEDLVAPLAFQKGDGSRANLFLLDVPPEAREALAVDLRRLAGAEPMAAPLVRARLVSVAGAPVQHHDHEGEGDGRGDGFRRREQNLSWRARLAPSERVVAGAYWPEAGPPRAEASLEEGFASAVGARLGDELVFEVMGQEVAARVTSLRKVRWTSFQLNFFILLHPSLLEGAPATHLFALEVDDAGRRQAIRAHVAAGYPTMTVIDIADVVARVSGILDLVSLVTRSLAGLMMASGLLVLTASLLAGRAGRTRDLALLRSLGASDRLLAWSLAWEFLVLGGSAAGLSGLAAWGLAWIYATRVLELESHPNPALGLVLLGGAALLTLGVGLMGSRRALSHKPLEVLRGE